MFEFERTSGRYRDLSSGKFVGRGVILRHVDRQSNFLSRTLQLHAIALTEGQISLGEFQRRMMHDLKRSHIRLAALGSGGKLGLNNRIYGASGQRLKEEYGYLRNFVRAIHKGELSSSQIINRARLYGKSSKSAFHKAEQIKRAENNAVWGWRRLDPNANHCPECPNYATKGYVLLSQIVPIGFQCSCRGNCRCSIVYKYSSRLSLEQKGILADTVANNS